MSFPPFPCDPAERLDLPAQLPDLALQPHKVAPAHELFPATFPLQVQQPPLKLASPVRVNQARLFEQMFAHRGVGIELLQRIAGQMLTFRAISLQFLQSAAQEVETVGIEGVQKAEELAAIGV